MEEGLGLGFLGIFSLPISKPSSYWAHLYAPYSIELIEHKMVTHFSGSDFSISDNNGNLVLAIDG